MWHDTGEFITGIVRCILYMAGFFLIIYVLAGIGARHSANNIGTDSDKGEVTWNHIESQRD